MKKIFSIFIFILPFLVNSQNKQAIDWITNNSIEIEDASPDSKLTIFEQNTPDKFDNAKIYGFGEASHDTKEFFDIKTKFFKHLVKTRGVKTFIMEASYQAESGINEWISGGKGDINTISKNFSFRFLYYKEIANLLLWMRNYNIEKPEDEQIRFYGMDIQIGKKINQEIRGFVKKYNLPISEELLIIADSCSNKKINYGKTDDWAKIQVPKLKKLEQAILNSETNTKINQKDLKSAIRSLNYLIKYTQYISNTVGVKENSEFRDLKMFQNVKWIIENESKNEKAFIWAHNEHINKKEMNYSGSDIINLGRLLKDYYKEDYYSVGFDFGSGNIIGHTIDEKQGNNWKTYYIEKPFKKTYAQTLMDIDKDIYFVDLDNAIKNEPSKFFSKKLKHLLIGGAGYQPEPLHRIMVNKIYAETYDGLIFVKKISPANYLNK